MPDERDPRIEADSLSRILKNLDSRISRIEQQLNLEPLPVKNEVSSKGEGMNADAGENLELTIGLYWFSKVGILALMIGIVFLLLRPFNSLPSVFAPALGFVLAIGAAVISRLTSRSTPLLSGYFLGSGLALLFFAVVRLRYFSPHPAVGSLALEITLLALVDAVSFYLADRRKSVYILAISVTMGLTIALLNDELWGFMGITFLMALLSVYLSIRHNRRGLLIFGMAATYITYLAWFVGNPVLSGIFAVRIIPQPGMFFIPILMVVFAAGTFFRDDKKNEKLDVFLSTIVNSSLGYALLLFVTIADFQSRLGIAHLVASFVLLVIATAFWLREKSRFQTFVYAMTGYAALSVAIIAEFHSPEFFIPLCWQSLLVVSTAVWYRSKFIVVANFIIYSVIFIAYLVVAGTVGITSLSFGVVALLSARILNWQQKRLELKTGKMRTAYLVAAFVIFPYALYHIVPGNYVSLSWLGIAVIYYLISLALKNMKYRWMALLTFLLTALYLIIVGVAKLEPVIRIISFLVLGVVLLVISFVYARAKMKTGSKQERTDSNSE